MRTLLLVLLMLAVAPKAEADVATEIPSVTARVAYARTNHHVLHVGVVFRNSTDRRITTNAGLQYADMFVVDRVAKRKHSPLRDATGRVIAGPPSDGYDGGRWLPDLEAHSETLVWVMFPALPAGRRFDLHVPLVPSFDGLAVDGSLPTKTVRSVITPLTATVVSHSRANGWLTVELAIENPSPHHVDLTPAILYGETFVLDPVGKKRYAVVSDSDGMWLASPTFDNYDQGRWFARLDSGQRVRMKLVFEAPSDPVRRVDLVLPWFAPIEAIALTGGGEKSDRGTRVTSDSRDL